MLHNKMINFALILWYCMIFIQNERVEAAESTFNEDVMVVKGQFMTSADIKNMLMLSNQNVSKIYVYLTDTFYADESLNLNGIKELQIFATTWNITETVTFDLSGPDGEDQGPANKAAAGSNGNAATDGGNFFGLANKTINGNYLTVISNGGNGGDGQDGGASDDVYVLLNVDEYNGETGWFSNGDIHSFYKKYFDDRGYDTEISEIDDYTSFYAVFKHDKKATFNVRLHPQKCCGTTGMGGLGGYGGRSGKFNFIHVGNSSETIPKFIADEGSVGKSGKDAKACENLALDVRIDTELKKVVFVVLPLHHSFSSKFTTINHTSSSKCKPEYIRNNHTMDLLDPMEIDSVSSVTRYKRFLIENMKYKSLTSMVQKTYKAIDENLELNNENTLKGLVWEACELEQKYFILKNSIKMNPLYRRLLDRVKRLTGKGLKLSDDRALNYFKKILRLKLSDLRSDYDLIINLESYTQTVIGSIDLRNQRLSAITDVNDVRLQDNLNQLRLGVNGNYILDQYFHVVEGFRLAYFPFAVDYLRNYNMPASPKRYNGLDDISIAVTNKLRTVNQSISSIKSNNGDIMMNLNYIDYTNPRYAFFVWKNSDVREEIRKLFDGEKVWLLADVKKSKKDYNAMKFKTIDIVFRSSNQSVNDQLNNALQSFELELTHTGLAATQCDGNFYQVNTSPLSIQISFEKDEHNVPMNRNQVYDMMRMKDNYPTLSPYALWEIQIVKASRDFQNMSELASFGELDIDIELHGTGKYVANDVPICDHSQLAKLYSKI